MDDVRLAPMVGIIASVSVMLVLAVPYVLLSPGSVSTYYTTGAFNPLFAGLFALVCMVVFAAGRSHRSDPALAAGVCLVFGLFIAGFSILWALTVPDHLVFSYQTSATFEYHRYVLILVGLAVPVCAAWYTHALKLI